MKFVKNALILAVILLPFVAIAQMVVTLAWDSNTNSNVVGYRVLSGPAPRVYTTTNWVNGGDAAGATVSNVPLGKRYFAVVSVDISGAESDPSNEVIATNRIAAPKNLRMVSTMQSSIYPTGPWKDMANVSVPVPLGEEHQQFFRAKVSLEEEEDP